MHRRDFLRQWPAWAAGWSAWPLIQAQTTSPTPSSMIVGDGDDPAVAFFYGPQPPLDALRLYDWVVLEPEHALAARADVASWLAPHSLAFAYVSVGEVHPQRPYAAALPSAWVRQRNEAWGSWVIDQSAPGWPAFFLDRVIAPLWNAGFRAFFLDTLDAYLLFATDEASRGAQAQALRETLRAMVRRWPQVRLMLNRGFELIDEELTPHVVAVAAESLYRRYDAASNTYVEVPEADRRWLLQRWAELKRRGLPGIAIDYVPLGQRDLARQTAQRIAAHGLIPWVADPALETLGVGAIEAVPREVLLLHDPVDPHHLELRQRSAHLYGALPLEALGLVPRYLAVDAPAPVGPLAGRYAGVVLYLDNVAHADAAVPLLDRARSEGVPVVLLGQVPAALLSRWGATLTSGRLQAPVQVRRAPDVPAAEALPRVLPEASVLLRANAQAQVWLWAEDDQGRRMDGAAITPWGGYALPGFALYNLPGGLGHRWCVEPIEFLRRALRRGLDPMPDVTTCVGRRAFFVHFDGDGWLNRCNLPGTPTAGEYLVREYLMRYRIPITASFIVGELSEQGVFPEQAALAQEWARQALALPHVQAASHTWSHPFHWGEASGKADASYELHYGVHLKLPGYVFDMRTEIVGAKDWIADRLCPPGKPVEMLLWSGDCNPPPSALALARQAGLGTLNGGGGTMSRLRPSLTALWPMGLPKKAEYQVYAPASNEMDYTNNWQPPYTGYEHVVDTFTMTDGPYRLKPVNIYFHPYLVTQPAGAKALHAAFAWALDQALHPITARQYHDTVHAWRAAAVGRRLDGSWRLSSPAPLRQWRQPRAAQPPSVSRSRQVAGWQDHGPLRYVHLTADRAELRSGAAAARIVDANAAIVAFRQRPDGGWQARLQGHVPVELRVELPAGWRVLTSARLRREGPLAVMQSASSWLEVQCLPG
ncbi:bifunctional glycoside hydrolase 114/ polysaccharide deacetylase family protein [Caldimonas taiwanensis]|uniref:bifunctional glycoside hydrolase 114/ polysaccharide deacetylase family protein n=1 Tax=Caldimonas taiwanensis TaxID=307483 RepID=UPI001E474862|nr:endo alpha-1,4 polygalactosaminidase [Caldimonas taiwanensis]